MSPNHASLPRASVPGTLQAVVLDMSGVITTQLEDAVADMLRAHRMESPAALRAAVASWARLYREASLGRIQPDELWVSWRRSCDLGALPAGREEAEFLARIHLREPGIPETLEALRAKCRLGLLSNHVARWGNSLLEHHHLRPFLHAVVFSSQLGARKPAPWTYERICQLIRVPPQQAMYVADEEEDLIGCQAVGMFPVFIPGQDAASRVGLCIDALSALPRLL